MSWGHASPTPVPLLQARRYLDVRLRAVGLEP